jgi:hypothetical protein
MTSHTHECNKLMDHIYLHYKHLKNEVQARYLLDDN